MIDSFTIRVYGLLLRRGKILLSKEKIQDGIYTKFPGGGLEFGEGTIDCLKREFMEEAQIDIHSIQHFYTTEDFVQSKFKASNQVLSIYYTVSSDEIDKLNLDLEIDGQVLFWKSLEELTVEDVDLVIDKKVVSKLLNIVDL
jgi:ADP-ribose pyrophosphatase YjhB (NUDIX family)